MRLEQLTKALSDSTRLRLVNLLFKFGELCVCDLVDALEISQPKISRHLALLRESGLLESRKAGLWVFYRLNPELPEWASATIRHLNDGSQGDELYLQDANRLTITERFCKLRCC